MAAQPKYFNTFFPMFIRQVLRAWIAPVPARYEAAVTALEEVLMLKRYTWWTVKVYKNYFRQFFGYYDDIKTWQITYKQMVGLVKERHFSESNRNQILSAIKMFYAKVVRQEEKVRIIIKPKRPQRLPQKLSEAEVVRLFNATENVICLSLILLVALRR